MNTDFVFAYHVLDFKFFNRQLTINNDLEICQFPYVIVKAVFILFPRHYDNRLSNHKYPAARIFQMIDNHKCGRPNHRVNSNYKLISWRISLYLWTYISHRSIEMKSISKTSQVLVNSHNLRPIASF